MKVVILIVCAMLVLTACGGGNGTRSDAQATALSNADQNDVYVPHNHRELDNYNAREQLTDDPNTIIWCTSAWSFTGTPMITVPIVGKLTSSNKRPFPTTVNKVGSDSRTYNPELPGADGMYGASGEYRYGFTPSGLYVDFTGMQTFCTNQVTVWQRENTTIVSEAAAP